ncbi:Histidine kinase [Sulfitobacter noctilucae]|uniref:sensor histidine kinase n=1 Tax=Sulfitobacter noctilucae TaxID=1342302 RepID=UPI000469C9E3|nr:PAS domain-containing sensor histidine kinase [Sulfitobacter noctilucae]KIN61366.1 Histidine kinase [Sulfitobacter noctilucae]
MSQTDIYAAFDLISAPVFVLEIDDQGAPVYVAFNEFARSVSGRPLTDYVGRTALEIYPGVFGRTAYAHHCAARDRAATMTYQLDLPVFGIARTIRTTLRPETDEAGKVLRLIGTSTDMTIEKHALEAKVQLDTMSSEMEQFVALAAHDLRGPMRNIALIADMLRDEFVDHGDGKLELMDTLESIALKTMSLITEVLSHVETVAVQASKTVFSFPAMCHDIVSTLDPHHQHVVVSTPATVETDRTALQIVLRNLLENAMKHGGIPHLHIQVDVKIGMAGMLDVTITDNGQGFEKDALKVMNRSEIRAESGYGLFGIKRLISARGGTLAALNLPDGSGAMIRFSLPGSYVDSNASLHQAEAFTPKIPVVPLRGTENRV